jgi:hypothetical protein
LSVDRNTGAVGANNLRQVVKSITENSGSNRHHAFNG